MRAELLVAALGAALALAAAHAEEVHASARGRSESAGRAALLSALQPPVPLRYPSERWQLRAKGSPVVLVDLGAGAGEEDGVGVGVGELWLRALHPRAQEALLLWRPPPRPAPRPAPRWLTAANGYVIAARDIPRIKRFLQDDFSKADYREEIFVPKIIHILRSTSPLMIHWLEERSVRGSVGSVHAEALNASDGMNVVYYLQALHGFDHWELLPEVWQKAGAWEKLHDDLTFAPRRDFPCAGLACFDAEATRRGKATGKMALLLSCIDNNFFGIPYAEKQLLDVLSKQMNVLWIYHRDFFFDGRQDKFLDGSQRMFTKVRLGYSDFAPHLAAVSKNWNLKQDYISSSAQLSDPLAILVPRAAPLPKWMLLVRAFPAWLWALLAAVAAAYALAWRVVAGESLGASVAAALRALSSCGGSPQDRVRATPQRLQLAAALLTSAIVMVALYQGRFYELMTQTDFYEEIDTFEQLVESNLIIYSPCASALTMYQWCASNSEFLEDGMHRKKAVKMRIKRTNLKEMIAHMKKNIRFAFIASNMRGDMKHIAASGRVWNDFHQMNVQVLSAVELYPVKNNWPFKDRVDSIYGRLIAAGITRKWEEIHIHSTIEIAREIFNPSGDPPDYGPQRLGLADVLVAFLLLGAGLLLAAAALAVELVQKRWGFKRRLQGRQRSVEMPDSPDTRASGSRNNGMSGTLDAWCREADTLRLGDVGGTGSQEAKCSKVRMQESWIVERALCGIDWVSARSMPQRGDAVGRDGEGRYA